VEEASVDDIFEVRGENLARVFQELQESRRTIAGVPVSPETALSCSAVLACVRVISETVAALPLNVYERLAGGGKDVANDYSLQLVLSEQPNGWMTSFEFRELMQSWMLLWGNAYAEIRPGKLGAVTELIPLHPSRMKVERLPNGRLRYVYKEPDAKETTYIQEQILHLRWLSKDGVTGYIPTTLSRDAIGLARATEIHSGAYFGNGARPGAVLESDQPIKPETAERLRRSWEDMHRGPDRSSKTAVLPFGIKLKELTGSNESSQLLETRRYQVEEVARAYRVPSYLIGDLTKSSYSSVEQQSIDFVTFSMVPHLRRWEGAIRRDLISDDRRYFAEFDVRGLLRGDAAARSSYYRELWTLGVLSINEIRESEGMNPIEDGDKRFVQVNMALLQSFVVEPPPAAEPPPEEAPVAEPPPEEAPVADEEPTRSIDPSEVLFRQTLRKCAEREFEGILARRGKPAKLEAWLQACEKRMRTELIDPANATGRDIDEFVKSWSLGTREMLLECHRSGTKYEEAPWQTRILSDV
jgi:HK97 family phage portal protein